MDPTEPASNFLRTLVADDLRTGRHTRVLTRFPPEPNGYLHIGHAKSICLNFGLGTEFGGGCNMRFDDTNPAKEEVEYVESILGDVRWLGFEWAGLFHASDYFDRMYEVACDLIRGGKAYVCSLSEAEIRDYRGTVEVAGRPSPGRERSVAENLDLFARMRAGEFPDGAHVLRGRIDMSAANMKLRDPLLYRIRHATHHRTGDAWCIYPMYDYAHPLSDAFEGITHSICTLEFENNRDLYDWAIRESGVTVVKQYEFARLHLTYTMMSKRKLLLLVKEGHVAGWDDPRMPTIAGLRRRGVTPEAIRAFCERIGVAKANSVVDVEVLDGAIREDLNLRAPRVMAVLKPLRVVIESWEAGRVEWLTAAHWPQEAAQVGSRTVPFTRELLIEADDFTEVPPPKFHRLAPGREVRLRYGYVIKCVGVDKDAAGNVVTVRCTHDPATSGGNVPDGRKVPGTLHWVSAAESIAVEVRAYDRLFTVEKPDAGDDFRPYINTASLTTITARAEPFLAKLAPGEHVQFERLGYYFTDPVDSRPGVPVFNRVVGLRDTWGKVASAPAARLPPPAVPALAPGAPPARVVTPAPDHAERHAAYVSLGLSAEDASTVLPLATIFDAAYAAHPNARSVVSWLVHETPREARDIGLPFGGAELGILAARVDAGVISRPAGKEVLAAMLAGEGAPDAIIAARGLLQVSDPAAVREMVDAVLAENTAQVAAYRAGKTALYGFFVGLCMKRAGGKAPPALVADVLKARLG